MWIKYVNETLSYKFLPTTFSLSAVNFEIFERTFKNCEV